MKLICKCGNVKDLNIDTNAKNFEFKNCGDGTIALICKNCSDVSFIKLKNS